MKGSTSGIPLTLTHPVQPSDFVPSEASVKSSVIEQWKSTIKRWTSSLIFFYGGAKKQKKFERKCPPEGLVGVNPGHWLHLKHCSYNGLRGGKSQPSVKVSVFLPLRLRSAMLADRPATAR